MRQFLPTLISLKAGDRVVVPKSNIRMVQHHAIYVGTVNGQYALLKTKKDMAYAKLPLKLFLAE